MKGILDIGTRIAASAWYWLGLIVLALGMEGVALTYQYAWDYGPCVLCIHVRLWLFGVLVAGGLALWLRRWRWANALLHAANTGLMFGMLHTSQMLLGTERGTIFASCNFDAGLPSWFALDKWFPAIFGVKESCGYTPELLFGITMAEALVVLSWTLLVLSGVMLLLSLFRTRR